MRTSLHCLAPDGESVTEGRDFQDIESAWRRSEDMGSRWFFYPIHIVTSSGPAAIIRSIPHGMPDEWMGRRLATLKAAFEANSEHVEDYCNGETPLLIFPP